MTEDQICELATQRLEMSGVATSLAPNKKPDGSTWERSEWRAHLGDLHQRAMAVIRTEVAEAS